MAFKGPFQPMLFCDTVKFHYGGILGGGKVSVSGLLKRCNEEDDLEAQVSMTCNRTGLYKTFRHVEIQLAKL